MKVLFLTERFPYPLDTGGNVRTFHLLRGLAAEHEITLIATTRGELQEADLREVGKLCSEIRLVSVPAASLARDVARLAFSLASRTPFVLSRHIAPAMQREVQVAFRRLTGATGGGRGSESARAFDVVHFNHLDAAMYAADIPHGVAKVLDQHNVVSNQVKTTLKNEGSLARRLLLEYEHAKIRTFEAQLCNRMDRTLVCSEADGQALRRLRVQSAVSVIPNGVDLEYFSPVPLTQSSDREVVFVGTLDYDPCEKGVWYFCTEILPLLRREIREIRFIVIGRNPSRRLQTLAASDPSIILTGRVADIRLHAQRARVFVAPLLSGSGTRLKILEAMAMGIPVVSTTIGAEGIEATPGDHLLLADEPREFSGAVLKLLRDPHEADVIRIRARRLVEEKYGWEAISRRLLQEYRSLPTRQRS